MKILVDLTSLYDNFSGIERYAFSLTRELVKNEKNSFVLVFKNEITPMLEEAANRKNVETLILKGKNRLIFNQLTLPAALYGQKADAFLFLAFPAPVLLFKRNMISAIHDIGCWDCAENMKTESKWYFRISYRAALLASRKIVTVSEFSRRRIMERLHVKAQKLELIYDGVDKEFLSYRCSDEAKDALREKYGLPQKYILSLSTLEPRKNLRLLIEAYEKLLTQRTIEEDLVLVGRKGWKIDNLLDGVSEQTRSRIRFTGFVRDKDLAPIYAMANLFVFPSKYEGFGLPPLEAMACGTPVLSSDVSAMPEVLGNAAVYFKSEDVHALRQKLDALLEMSEQERSDMARAGRERAKLFLWEQEAKKLEAVLEGFAQKN